MKGVPKSIYCSTDTIVTIETILYCRNSVMRLRLKKRLEMLAIALILFISGKMFISIMLSTSDKSVSIIIKKNTN